MDVFEEIGCLGLGSRLKRLSDLCLADVQKIYAESDVDFEPRWFPVFILLIERRAITVSQAVEILGISQPHVSVYVREMAEAGLIEFRKNPEDGRSKHLVPSRKALNMAKKLQPIWKCIDKAVRQLLIESEPQFLASIAKVEEALGSRSLYDRVTTLRASTKKRTANV